MKIELTDEQKAAVFAPVGENLVSAAAGSGKTKVLSERIAYELTSGDTSIDRLLIVTFTRAAAAQMREKIGEALEEAYREKPSAHLKKQLSLLPGADICTIDSFCIDLLRKNFFVVSVPPDFTVADENEMVILREEAVLEVLEEEYEKGDEGFLALSDSVGKGKNDENLKNIILKVYSFTRGFADPEAWLDRAVRAHLAGSDENNALYNMLKREIREQLKDFGDMLHDAKKCAEEWGVDAYAQVFESECLSFERYLCDMEKTEEGIGLFEFGNFKGKKVDPSYEAEKISLQNMHDGAKKFFRKIVASCSILAGERGVSYSKTEALVRCVRSFSEKYTEEKLKRKELEFCDCEYLALKALEESGEAVEELRKKYDEIYIDEYQDTNPLQDTLFTLISRKAWGEPNLFIVGDVKQSIYRFRHSDPELFSNKAKTFGKDGKSRKMILSKNFRSRREVLDSVNCVFEKIMREGTGGVDYNSEHALRHGMPFIEYNKNKSELYILTDEAEDGEDELKKEQKEARVAAGIIKKMMDEGFMVSDKGRMRKMEYSDVAVLSPSISGKADMIANVFNLMEVPVYCEAEQNFFDTLEVRTVISLLKALDNPLSDIPLASVMRSGVFSFDENELLSIREEGLDKPFYENVLSKAAEESPIGSKCKKFVETMDKWRELSYVISLERLISRLIDESGYYSFVGALPGGGARQENLRQLAHLAGSYEQTQYKGLYNFVRYIDKTIACEGKVETEKVKQSDAVLVTTIHKSKGLEFPVVIVIGCGNKFNEKNSTSDLILSPEGGIGLVEKDIKRRIKYKPGEYKAISMMIKRAGHAEQMRLLYVAMTRAKEKLILIGTEKNYDKKSPVWEEYRSGREMSDYLITEINCYLDYVMSSIDFKYWDMFVVNELPPICEKKESREAAEREYTPVEDVIYRLSYAYPYDGIKNIPSKMSVSEIKKLSMDEEAVFLYNSKEEKRVPSFMKKDNRLSGASRGTAYHRVLELIDVNERNVQGAIDTFLQKGLITKSQAESVDKDKIEKFLSSPVAGIMRRAKKVWKEESFTMTINARDVFIEGEDEKIVVQGTIDCLIRDENDRLILLDYKTDFYNEPEEVGEKYIKQLELYELAVFDAFGQKCDKKYLYLLHKNDIIAL